MRGGDANSDISRTGAASPPNSNLTDPSLPHFKPTGKVFS
jgi:hypothetical protein